MTNDDRDAAPLAMRPQGFAGRAFGVVMEKINLPSYRLALKLLAPQDNQHFLEIGFGTGRLVELLLEAARNVHVAGIDPTPTMVEVASSKRGIMRTGTRADLREGSAGHLPWGDASFNGVTALHSFQFWAEPMHALVEIRRVLKPGGRLALILRDHGKSAPSWLPNPISRSGREYDATCEALAEAGFGGISDGGAAGSSRAVVARKL